MDRLIHAVGRDGNKGNISILQLRGHTGIRVGELPELRLSDIEVSERKGTLTVRSGKGSKYHQVSLNNDARQARSPHLDVGHNVTDDVGQRGIAPQLQAVQHLPHEYAQATRLVNVMPHAFRHSFGKQALDAGVSIITVAKLPSHQHLETTAIYT